MLWVAAGGACGALLRYAVQSAATASLPWGTFLVNVAGCLGIGGLLAAFSGSPWFEAVGRPFLVFGVLGAFTTFSAFSADTLVLYEEGRFGWALAYVVGTVSACLLAAFVGFRLVGALR